MASVDNHTGRCVLASDRHVYPLVAHGPSRGDASSTVRWLHRDCRCPACGHTYCRLRRGGGMSGRDAGRRPNHRGNPMAAATVRFPADRPVRHRRGASPSRSSTPASTPTPAARDRVAAGRDFLDGGGRPARLRRPRHRGGQHHRRRPGQGAGLRGLAPGVTIVPIRVSEQRDTDGGGRRRDGRPGPLRQGDPGGGRATAPT